MGLTQWDNMISDTKRDPIYKTATALEKNQIALPLFSQ
uniref:Uncharacterized protein n=1 Tax=Rhizophora mucronata TaxID=61149 RepID=A0A2P2NKY9_RHIMU